MPTYVCLYITILKYVCVSITPADRDMLDMEGLGGGGGGGGGGWV